MSSAPQYAALVNTNAVQLTVANTARDGSGTLGTVYSAGTSGSRIDDIAIAATGATTSGMIRLFICSSTVNYLWKELLVAANTPSASNPAWKTELTDLALLLESTWSLKASTNNAETFNVIVTRAGDF